MSTAAKNLLLSFYGDDFTGSTDALESLARCGVRTVLFTDPPTPRQLGEFPGLEAFGVAGMTRSLSPQQMEQTLRPALAALRNSGARIVHYKVCSTFDSSPTVGSIGRVIEIGAEIFPGRPIPIVPAAPALGRYCVFGNLFARCGVEPEPHRLDRHPSMSRHPITPMDEADLRKHLARQTARTVGLIDALHLEPPELARIFRNLKADAVIIDALYENQLAAIGNLLLEHADASNPLFVIGSSGVESALCAAWNRRQISFNPVPPAEPTLVISGSRSPVTAGQIKWAIAHGFADIGLESISESSIDATVAQAVQSLQKKSNAVVHTGGRALDSALTSSALGQILRKTLESVAVGRVIVAGGDTASHVARAVGIQSVEMIGELTRGSPLCRAAAPNSPADGLEITFKGGQIGPEDFFSFVARGSAN